MNEVQDLLPRPFHVVESKAEPQCMADPGIAALLIQDRPSL